MSVFEKLVKYLDQNQGSDDEEYMMNLDSL